MVTPGRAAGKGSVPQVWDLGTHVPEQLRPLAPGAQFTQLQCCLFLKVLKMLKTTMTWKWSQMLRGGWRPTAHLTLMTSLRAAPFVSTLLGTRLWGHHRAVPITSAWTASWSGPR